MSSYKRVEFRPYAFSCEAWRDTRLFSGRWCLGPGEVMEAVLNADGSETEFRTAAEAEDAAKRELRAVIQAALDKI